MNKEEFLKLFTQCVNDGNIYIGLTNNKVYISIYDDNRKEIISKVIK